MRTEGLLFNEMVLKFKVYSISVCAADNWYVVKSNQYRLVPQL